MVERIFTTLSAPIRGLHQAAYVLALLTIASQVLALLRDRVFAHAFGASTTLDLYYSAFRIPDIVFALVASLVSAYVLIPRIAGRGSEEVRTLLSQSVSFLLIVGGVVCAMLAWLAPEVLAIVYPSFVTTPDYAAFVSLTRLLLLQPIILGISGAITSVTQVHRRFILFALSPVLYNLGIIIGAWVLYPRYGLEGIGLGVVIGALMHAGLHVPVLLRARVMPRLTIPSWRVLRGVVYDSLPRSLALSIGSITALILTVFASRISEGSVSVFTFASNLEAVPLSLIGASYAVAAFPALAEHRASDNKAEFSRVLIASARNIVVWSTVFLGLIVVLRAHIVRVVLGTGAFDWEATRLTAALLALFALALAAQGLTLLFSRALYAVQESWRPFFFQLLGGVVTIGLAWYLLTAPPEGFMEWLSATFRVADVSSTAVLTLAFATACGQWLLASLALVALLRTVHGLARSLVPPLIQGLVATVVGGVAAYGSLFIEGGIAPLTTFAAVFTEGVLAGIVGLATAGGVLSLLKNEEFNDLLRAIGRLSGIKMLPPSAVESTPS